MIEQAKNAFKELCPVITEWRRTRRRERLCRRIHSILTGSGQTETCDENSFQELQAQYPSRDVYKYDSTSIWRRGVERAGQLIESAALSGGANAVEIGCGDGMVSAALALFGCKVVLVDLEDWRDVRARGLEFTNVNPCVKLPLPEASADLVFSYNTFEHLANPAAAFAEAMRICRPGGFIYLDFNPLFASPWGLHAYRTIHMPYAQFLFSASMLKKKLAEVGIHDLGKTRNELQPLNRWRLGQFEQLWRREGCSVISRELPLDFTHADLILKFPRAFRGRGLTIEDVVTSGIRIVLKKNG